MHRETPAILADEISTSGGLWRLSNARLRPSAREENASLGVSIEMSGSDAWSDVALYGGPPAARAAAASLKRSGYEIFRLRSKPFHARRWLRGSRELDAEVSRLEALAADASSLATFPPRRPRPRSLPKGTGRFAETLFQRLRHEHGWSPVWVSAGRNGQPAFAHVPGWTAGAWCLALDDGEDRMLEICVQVFSKSSSRNVDPDELSRLIRTFRSQLGPLGYKLAKINWPAKRPQFAVFTKGLATLAAARRERRVLDRALFGDQRRL
jgi:hypothetical protein